MHQKRVYEWIIFGLWLLIAILLIEKDKKILPEKLVEQNLNGIVLNQRYNISKVVVLKGNLFEFTLEDNNSKILCKLLSETTSDAKKEVVDLFKSCENPNVSLLEKTTEGYWTCQVSVNLDSKQVDLDDWLKKNNLSLK